MFIVNKCASGSFYLVESLSRRTEPDIELAAGRNDTSFT